jgi:hypothetical protein
MLVGGGLLTQIGRTTPLTSLLPAYIVFGIGFGMINPPITATAVVGMPPEQAGVAAAVASTSRQVGQTLGVAVVGAIAAAGASTVGPDFLANSHIGYGIVAGCGAVMVVLGLFSTTERARASARRAIRPVESPVTL